MTTRLILMTVMLGLLAGCSSWGESRINPATWFDRRDRPETLVPIEEELFLDPRPLVTQVSDVTLDRSPGGVIVRATGLPPTMGYWLGDLVLEQRDGQPVDGTLSFQFRIAPPVETTATAPATAREVVVARFISNQQLQGVTTIRVLGAGNERSVRP